MLIRSSTNEATDRFMRDTILLQLCGAVLSSPQHGVLLSASGKREYHMPGALALDAGA